MTGRNSDLRRRSVLAALATCAIAWALPAPSAVAADAASVGFQGSSAGALFTSAAGCAQDTALVMPVDGRTRDNRTGATSESSVLIQLLHFDVCTLAQSFRFGMVDLDQADFHVRGNLGGASLRAAVELQDWFTGDAVPLVLDLTWEAAGETLWDRTGHHTRSEDGTIDIFRGAGAIRAATAWGSIWDGVHEYTAGAASGSANMASSRAGQVTVVR